MAEEKKEPVELRCAVCQLLSGEAQWDGSLAVIKLVTVISKSANEPNASQKELTLCGRCNEVGKQQVLYKCIKCQSALVFGHERNPAVFETKDDEGRPIFFSFNDNLAKMLGQPVEDIKEKAVILFIDGCPICTPRHGCGGCDGKCGGHDHGEHKCGDGCHENCSHEKDKF